MSRWYAQWVYYLFDLQENALVWYKLWLAGEQNRWRRAGRKAEGK